MDATPLLTAADRIAQHAMVLRGRAQVVARHRDTVRWHSAAARRCDDRLDTLCARMSTAGGELDALADAVRSAASLVSRGP